jgi:hypothetical protein
MNDYKIFIHVGLHKTGTTFLQKNVFQNIKNVNYFNHNSNLFDFLSFSLKKDKINLISHENFSASPIYQDAGNIRFIIAEKLNILFPNAKIIIGTREIDSWLQSMYRQTIKNGNHKNFIEWKNNLEKDYWNIQKYIDHLKELFPEVYEYKMKDLKKNNEKIIGEICEFMGVEVPHYNVEIINKSLNEKQVKVLRFMNSFFKSRYNPNGKIPRAPFDILFKKIRK